MNCISLLKLWQDSNCDTIFIKGLARVNHKKEIITSSLILNKRQRIMLGEELTSYEYIQRFYSDAIFEYCDNEDGVIHVKVLFNR